MISMRTLLIGSLTALAFSTSANAANLIKNGSFENSGLGNGAVSGWTRTNTPTNVGADTAASVIAYNGAGVGYPNGAFGEAVTPDTNMSSSPDAVGNQAAYFVGDFSVNETLGQMTYLGVGNYKIGFSYYLTGNGLANPNNASLAAQIIGVPVAFTTITGTSAGQTWYYASGVAQITVAGHYATTLVFNSNGFPAKDIVVDRVFAVSTLENPTVLIPGTPSTVPEPESWALMIVGFGLVGVSARRRKANVAA